MKDTAKIPAYIVTQFLDEVRVILNEKEGVATEYNKDLSRNDARALFLQALLKNYGLGK